MGYKKLLGNGLQYKVYNIGNNRVLKIPTTLINKIQILRSWGEKNPVKIIKGALAAEKLTQSSLEGIIKRKKYINGSFTEKNGSKDIHTTI